MAGAALPRNVQHGQLAAQNLLRRAGTRRLQGICKQKIQISMQVEEEHTSEKQSAASTVHDGWYSVRFPFARTLTQKLATHCTDCDCFWSDLIGIGVSVLFGAVWEVIVDRERERIARFRLQFNFTGQSRTTEKLLFVVLRFLHKESLSSSTCTKWREISQAQFTRRTVRGSTVQHFVPHNDIGNLQEEKAAPGTTARFCKMLNESLVQYSRAVPFV